MLPPLRERQEDIPRLLDVYVDKYCSYYRKYIVLTDDARELIATLPWPGNALQLRLFIEKLVLVSESKVVDAQIIRLCQPLTFSAKDQLTAVKAPAKLVVYSDREAKRILQLLDECGGNRIRVAQAMGISKSTLWRHMKKFGIEHTFKV
jgi:DNA-binding NtrC family response regulator